MTEQARALLDRLMGQDRDLLPWQKGKQITWSDYTVCKHFLAGICPHLLFENTKESIGTCSKLHEVIFREQYRASSSFQRRGFENSLYAFIERLVRRKDRDIKRKKLDTIKDESDHLRGKVPEKIQEFLDLDARLEELHKASNRDSQDQVKKLERQQESLKDELGPLVRTKVCDACGGLLGMDEPIDRVQAHNEGRLHQGYERLRTELAGMRRMDWGKHEVDLEEDESGEGSFNLPDHGHLTRRYPPEDRHRERRDDRSYRRPRSRSRSPRRPSHDQDGYRDRDRIHRPESRGWGR
eukprot:Clim_evm26s225 gene=Clim_evmTU26s225